MLWFCGYGTHYTYQFLTELKPISPINHSANSIKYRTFFQMSKLEREWLQLSNNATVLAKAFPHRDNEWSHASYILLAALITFLLAAVGFVLIKYYFPRQDKPVNTNP